MCNDYFQIFHFTFRRCSTDFIGIWIRNQNSLKKSTDGLEVPLKIICNSTEGLVMEVEGREDILVKYRTWSSTWSPGQPQLGFAASIRFIRKINSTTDLALLDDNHIEYLPGSSSVWSTIYSAENLNHSHPNKDNSHLVVYKGKGERSLKLLQGTKNTM